MDRMEGEGEPVLRHRLIACFEQHLLGDDALLAHAGEDRVTRLPRRLGMPVRAQPFRRARHCWSDRKSTRLNSSHVRISYAVFCLKKKNHTQATGHQHRTHQTTAPSSSTTPG